MYGALQFPEFDKVPGGETKWLMLIQRVNLGLDFDEAPETGDKMRYTFERAIGSKG